MSFFWFVKKSLILDLHFLRVCTWSNKKKINFLIKKYLEILLYLFRLKKFELGVSYVSIFNRQIYYDSPLGLSGYQSILTRHNNLIKIAKIRDVKLTIDIGANVGFFSLLIRELFPKSWIIAVEPAEQTYKALFMNFNKDKNIILVKKAISDRNGFSDLTINTQSSAISSLNGLERKGNSEKFIVEKVGTTTLDSLIPNRFRTVDILKIDVESFEKQVLKGAKKTLMKTRYLLIEITIEGNKNYTFSEINSMLYSKEYNFQLVGFRNYADVSEGKMPLGDFLFKNINIG